MNMIDVALCALVLSLLLAVYRLVVGPTDADRAAAADFTFYLFVAAAALLGVRLDAPVMFNVVLVATLIGFLGTVFLARLVDRSPR